MLSQSKAESWTGSLIASLREVLGPQLGQAVRSDMPGLVRVDLELEHFKGALPGVKTALSRAEVDSFDDLFAFENAAVTEIIVRFYASRTPGREFRLGLLLKPGAKASLPRISKHWPSARSCENEISELFNLQFDNDDEASPVSFSIDPLANSAKTDTALGGEAIRRGGESS